ncbi:MAG: MBL fold metallo-hydrolase [Actinobacteria bacterium]|nr:MBL fold metallo-hydrolase [Actinomycetota bacterium]
MVVEGEGFTPLVFDLGTGLRFWGLDVLAQGPTPLHATALVSHLHWDHVQGLPFFPPIHLPETRLHIVGPPQVGRSLEDAFNTFLCPPYFPVRLDQLIGTVTFEEATGAPIHHGTATVTTSDVPHVGPTIGYRVAHEGRSVAYVSDHQQPGVGASEVAESVLELCRDVDVLIHDAQYNDDEFALRHDWGHCTIDYAVEVARQANAKRLVLFHHDPAHDDDQVERLGADARARSLAAGGPDVIVGFEGLVLEL